MYPNFIGIGAQKAGTTWLFNILKQHPQIWMHPIKELHFFDLPGTASHIKRILLKEEGYRFSIRQLKTTLKQNFHPSFIRYFFGKRNLKNYRHLFFPNKGQISGEITPAYSHIKEEKIKSIHQAIPNLKIIYILRNPLERDWSHICMDMKVLHQTYLPAQKEQDVIKILKNDALRRSDYARNLQRWAKYFPKEQIFIAFYEELEKNPKKFLDKIFHFLEIPVLDWKVFEKIINRKINSFATPIPEDLQKKIAKMEYASIKRTDKIFNNIYTNDWLEKAEDILRDRNKKTLP